MKGTITIKISLDRPRINLLKFSVEDTGMGIEDSIKNQLFQLWGTYDNKFNTNQHGVGLGLTIVQKLV